MNRQSVLSVKAAAFSIALIVALALQGCNPSTTPPPEPAPNSSNTTPAPANSTTPAPKPANSTTPAPANGTTPTPANSTTLAPKPANSTSTSTLKPARADMFIVA